MFSPCNAASIKAIGVAAFVSVAPVWQFTQPCVSKTAIPRTADADNAVVFPFR